MFQNRVCHFFIVVMIYLSGCICQTGVDDDTTVPTTIVTLCPKPYLKVGSDCCLDKNMNGVCDSDEIPATTNAIESATTTLSNQVSTLPRQVTPDRPAVTLPPSTTTTTVSITTTTAEPTCSDGVLNQDEKHVDCGGKCSTACDVLRLVSGWKEYMGYKFRLEEIKTQNKQTNYYIHVKTPDGLSAEHLYVNTGESYIDHLRFKAINYPEDTPEIAVRLNVDDLSTIPSDATLLSIGGTSCPTYMTDNVPLKDVDLCCRSYNSYKVCLKSRQESKVLIQAPDYSTGKLDLFHMKNRYFDNALTISVFDPSVDRKYFIPGGYMLVYIKPVG